MTNAEARHHLAVVRSLGRGGYHVVSASHSANALGFYSRYCSARFLHPDPGVKDSFVGSMLDAAKRLGIRVIVPVGGEVASVLCEAQDELKPYAVVPLPERESMEIASNKNKTIRLAERLRIPVPPTFIPESIDALDRFSTTTGYPLVVKAAEGRGSVRYVHSPEELIKTYKELCFLHGEQVGMGSSPQVQQYVSGAGYGFFALFNRGRPRAIFCHRRIHELPPTGGVSTMARSVRDPRLEHYGTKILKALDWHGVAMVEFKKEERSGEFRLIEINPKFWGSLELAVWSGVDFPLLLVKMCVDGDVPCTFSYRDNAVYRWLAPDLQYSVERKKLRPFLASLLDRSLKNDVHLDDIRPSGIDLRRTVIEMVRSSVRSRLGLSEARPRVGNGKMLSEPCQPSTAG